MTTGGLLSLSNEVLRDILDHIDADPERRVSIDRRAYLSVESFRPPDPPPPPRAQDIANFRLTCRRFAELGVSHQFTKIATRFSRRGFDRLNWIASREHLARHTKKFSYLIPCFYVEGYTRIQDLIDNSEGELQSLDVTGFEAKIGAQKSITESKLDVEVLNRAIRAFTSLQHVQILRLQDQADSSLLDYLYENSHHAEFVDLKWSSACTHASRTIADALMAANSPVTRFSGPMMNPQSLVYMKSHAFPKFLPLAERLTCLELNFDDSYDLTNRIRSLSELFRTCFRAARNMQAVHLGFPSRAPLDLPLETIFHGIRWEKLRAFGVQAWRLSADEILAFARRHRKTLRGLRLRDVQLRRGSLWKDVLASLREEMDQLEWVSLRRIDYAENFDAMWSGTIEVPTAWPPGLESDSEDGDEGDGFHEHVNLNDDDPMTQGDDTDVDDFNDDDISDTASQADSDNGPEANELELVPDASDNVPGCICWRGGHPLTAQELGDNGKHVLYAQRKLWEKWVVSKCPEHGPIEDS